MTDHYLDVLIILSAAVVAASLLITETAAEVCSLNCTSSNTIQNTFNLSCGCLNGTAALNCSKPADIWTCELTAYPTSTCNEFVCRSHEQSSQNYSCSCFIRSGFDTTSVPNSSTPNHTITSHQKTCFGSGEEDFLECTIGVSISLAVIVVIVGIIIILAKRMKCCKKRTSARQPPPKKDDLQLLERTGTIPNTYAPDQRQAHKVNPGGYSDVKIMKRDIPVGIENGKSDGQEVYLPMGGENPKMNVYENVNSTQTHNTQETQLPKHYTASANVMKIPQAQTKPVKQILTVKEKYEIHSPDTPKSSQLSSTRSRQQTNNPLEQKSILTISGGVSAKIPTATSVEDSKAICKNTDSNGKKHSNAKNPRLESKIQAYSTNEKQHPKKVPIAAKQKRPGSEEVESTQRLPEEHDYVNVALPTQAKTIEEQDPEKLMTATTTRESEKASKATSASPQHSLTPTTHDSAADGDVQNPFIRNLLNQLKSVKQTNTSSNKRPQVPPPLPSRAAEAESDGELYEGPAEFEAVTRRQNNSRAKRQSNNVTVYENTP